MDSKKSKSGNNIKILITGSGGFIGSSLVRFLSSKSEYDLKCLVKNKKGLQFGENVELFEGNLLDKQSFENVIDQCEVIIHLAATRQHFKNPEFIIKNNVESTRNLLESYLDVKQIIFASSTLASNPQDTYSRSKKKCEELIKKSGINHTILRIGPVFGKGDQTNITKIITHINEGKLVPLPGGGKQVIQPTHVDDVIMAIDEVILNEKYYKKNLIVAGKPIKLADFVKDVSKILDKKERKFGIPMRMLKPVVSVYQNISKNPGITVEQLENLERMSSEVFNSDFPISPFVESIKKSV